MMFLKRFFVKKKFIYAELAPKQRFLKILETYVVPKLENDGFQLVKSSLELKKVVGDFEWIVEFTASKWNAKNEICQFTPHFTVRHKGYRSYLKTQGRQGYGQIGSTYGIEHWDKKVFSKDGKEAYFLESLDFAKYDNDKLVQQLVTNIQEVGVPFFEMMSDFDSILHFNISQNLRSGAPMLIDLGYLLGRKDSFSAIFNWYEASTKKLSDSLEEAMHIRKKVYFSPSNT